MARGRSPWRRARFACANMLALVSTIAPLLSATLLSAALPLVATTDPRRPLRTGVSGAADFGRAGGVASGGVASGAGATRRSAGGLVCRTAPGGWLGRVGAGV